MNPRWPKRCFIFAPPLFDVKAVAGTKAQKLLYGNESKNKKRKELNFN